MASTNTTLVLPNPYTPLAFLPPTLADQFQISAYVFVVGLSAFVWDWLMSIPDEYTFLRKTKISVPNVVYFLSRFGTLAYCTTATIFQAASVADCQAFLYIIASSFVIAMPATSLLFFYRVRAVWGNSKIITAFFGVLWLGNLGTSVLVPLAVTGAHIGTTQRCINTAVRSYASTPIVLNAINDTLIFLAISCRIVAFTVVGETRSAQIKSFVSGNGLPRISKGLLQGGQLYYFATIGLSIVMSAMVLSPGVPPVYRAMLSVPNIALENAMACRVFRAVKLGLIKDVRTTSYFGTTTPSSRLQFAPDQDIALKQSTFDSTRNTQVNVKISKATDIAQFSQDDLEYGKPVPIVKEDSDASDRV